MITVRPLALSDHDAWVRLWQGYCEFYNSPATDEITSSAWERLIDPNNPDFLGFVAEHEGNVVGIANCVLHGTTWSSKQRCYLNDLFVDPAARGLGAGKALIQHLRTYGAEAGWEKIHWLTAEDNAIARRLYDQFAPATGFIQYSIFPESEQ